MGLVKVLNSKGHSVQLKHLEEDSRNGWVRASIGGKILGEQDELCHNKNYGKWESTYSDWAFLATASVSAGDRKLHCTGTAHQAH